MKKFKMRRQEEGKPVDSFITSLYWPAEHCNYRDLHDEMIWEWIIVGLRDSNLSERLQTDPELTIDKAITMAWQTEAVREQQAVVRDKKDNTCTRIEAVEHSYSSIKTTNCAKAANKKGCTRCRKFLTHPSVSLVKLHAVSVKSKATISQCVDQSQIWQQYEQTLSTRNPS